MSDSAAPRVVTSEAELAHAAARFAKATRVAFDLESNGMFAYRARICTLQLGAGGGGDSAEIVIVDALATSIAPLGPLLTESGPVKVVHDVSFDARMLAELSIELGNVHDTSISARMLGRTATGLATLLASELGVNVDKSLQHHDWGARPLEAPHLAYLGGDVLHLEKLDDVLWSLVVAAGIEAEVLEETRYRLRSAIESTRPKSPGEAAAYMRVKGIDALSNVERAIVRELWDAREEEAMRLDVPPYKVIGNEALVAIAKARPASRADLARVRGATHGRAMAMSAALVRAVAEGVAAGDIPQEERALLEKPRIPSAIAKARRARETRLMAWRKAEAQKRGVDEQVVLPGHCVKDIAETDGLEAEGVMRIAGFGACRAQYAAAIAEALRAPGPEQGGNQNA